MMRIHPKSDRESRHRRATFLILPLVLLMVATLSTPPVSAAPGAPEGAQLTQTSMSRDRSAPDSVDISELLEGVSVELTRERDPQRPYLGNSPEASVGLGWYIYLRFSPREQRFVMSVGAAAVAALICVASGGTACIVAGFAAATIGYWVAYFYNTSCWIEIKLTYSGQ